MLEQSLLWIPYQKGELDRDQQFLVPDRDTAAWWAVQHQPCRDYQVTQAACQTSRAHIYRVKDSLSLPFALLDKKPIQQTTIDIHGLLINKAEQRLPFLIELKLRRPLR